MPKTDRCIVRNEAYQKKSVSIRERHNERKNQGYANPDIVKDHSNLNVHFKSCEGSYAETFDRMIADGIISTRGLKPDAKVIDELIFDVNTAYFDRNGGYEYAREFFAEAYRLAVKEAGGEQYVLSAVMHADERNRALSEQLGRDVFHYHLHVVYVPVVDKEIKWTKRCKDPALVGTTKEIIKQVSHSKKWPKLKRLDENGEPVLSRNGKLSLSIPIPSCKTAFLNICRRRDIRILSAGSAAAPPNIWMFWITKSNRIHSKENPRRVAGQREKRRTPCRYPALRLPQRPGGFQTACH